MKNINLGAYFLFLLILCNIKIERLFFLKFLKNLAFFDSYFWPFNKSEEKIKVIFVISAMIPSIWNFFIKFCWHDEKLTSVSYVQWTCITFFFEIPPCTLYIGKSFVYCWICWHLAKVKTRNELLCRLSERKI